MYQLLNLKKPLSDISIIFGFAQIKFLVSSVVAYIIAGIDRSL